MSVTKIQGPACAILTLEALTVDSVRRVSLTSLTAPNVLPVTMDTLHAINAAARSPVSRPSIAILTQVHVCVRKVWLEKRVTCAKLSTNTSHHVCQMFKTEL